MRHKEVVPKVLPVVQDESVSDRKASNPVRSNPERPRGWKQSLRTRVWRVDLWWERLERMVDNRQGPNAFEYMCRKAKDSRRAGQAIRRTRLAGESEKSVMESDLRGEDPS